MGGGGGWVIFHKKSILKKVITKLQQVRFGHFFFIFCGKRQIARFVMNFEVFLAMEFPRNCACFFLVLKFMSQITRKNSKVYLHYSIGLDISSGDYFSLNNLSVVQ